MEDKLYDVPFNPLEGLPSSLKLKVPFSLESLSFDEFSTILASRRNDHVLDLMLFFTKYTNNVHKFVNMSSIFFVHASKT